MSHNPLVRKQDSKPIEFDGIKQPTATNPKIANCTPVLTRIHFSMNSVA